MLSTVTYLPSKLRAWAGTGHPGSSRTVDEDSDRILCNGPKRSAKIAIIGSGWLGRAISSRLVEANYDVVIGTRNPNEMVDSKFEMLQE